MNTNTHILPTVLDTVTLNVRLGGVVLGLRLPRLVWPRVYVRDAALHDEISRAV